MIGLLVFFSIVGATATWLVKRERRIEKWAKIRKQLGVFGNECPNCHKHRILGTFLLECSSCGYIEGVWRQLETTEQKVMKILMLPVATSMPSNGKSTSS